jgi:hypothetical protein
LRGTANILLSCGELKNHKCKKPTNNYNLRSFGYGLSENR